jgi:hypothetical protein
LRLPGHSHHASRRVPFEYLPHLTSNLGLTFLPSLFMIGIE